jgi:hypothetical protein
MHTLIEWCEHKEKTPAGGTNRPKASHLDDDEDDHGGAEEKNDITTSQQPLAPASTIDTAEAKARHGEGF